VKTLYDLFGVKSNVTQGGLRRAYLSCTKRCHPDTIDKNRKPLEWSEANRASQELNSAYFILRDPVSREQYDKSLLETTPKPEAVPAQETGADSFRPRPYSATYTPSRPRPAAAEPVYKAFTPPTTHWAYPNTELDGWFGVFAQWLYKLPIIDKLLVLLGLLLTLAVGGYLLLLALYKLFITYVYPTLITN